MEIETKGKAILLLYIGITSVALINPVTGSMMGQDNMTGQSDMRGKMIGQCLSEECKTMMGTCPENKTCMMMQPMIGTCPENMTCMMQSVVGKCPEGANCYTVEHDRDTGSEVQARLDCAEFWLKKATELHELHLRDASTTTNESQIELMDQITKALECVTGENVTSHENFTIGSDQAQVDEHGH